MSWERTERTLAQIKERLPAAETPEQCQAIGQLSRDALISLAQAVFRPAVHWRVTDPVPSPTDAKRMLEAYAAFILAGGGAEEARLMLRSAVQLADAITHKRNATPKDARLAAAAAESVIHLIAIADDHRLQSDIEGWQGVTIGSRYFAWEGPRLHALGERFPIPTPPEVLEALNAAGLTPSFGLRDRIHQHLAQGRKQVYETDRESWRRELLYTEDGSQVLLVY